MWFLARPTCNQSPQSILHGFLLLAPLCLAILKLLKILLLVMIAKVWPLFLISELLNNWLFLDDVMKCYGRVSYGPHVWELPPSEINFPENMDKYKWFGKAFLEGSVFPVMRHFLVHTLFLSSLLLFCFILINWCKKEHYEAHPLLLTKSFSNPRIVALLQPLIDKKIDTKKKLLEAWYDIKRRQKWVY